MRPRLQKLKSTVRVWEGDHSQQRHGIAHRKRKRATGDIGKSSWRGQEDAIMSYQLNVGFYATKPLVVQKTKSRIRI